MNIEDLLRTDLWWRNRNNAVAPLLKEKEKLLSISCSYYLSAQMVEVRNELNIRGISATTVGFLDYNVAGPLSFLIKFYRF